MKPFYKSQTIINAIAGYLVLVTPILYNSYQNERFPTEVEVAAILGGAYTLKQTIEGRIKATDSIGKQPTNLDLIDWSDVSIDVPPDFDEVLAMPSSIEAQPIEEEVDVDFQENGELDVDLDLDGNYKIKVLQDSKLKISLEDSSELEEDEKKSLEEGQEFEIQAYRFIGKNNHIEVRIENNLYYLYVPHIKLYNNSNKEVNLVDNSSPVKVVNPRKTAFKLPGNVSTFYLEDSVIPGGNFTWSEVTHGGTRIPATETQVANAIKLCKHLQGLREYLGNVPMRVTSFGRPEPINSRVGGAKNSYHTKYAACDFSVPGHNMRAIQEKVKTYWLNNKIGGVGEAPSAGKSFIHVDLGPVRTFPY